MRISGICKHGRFPIIHGRGIVNCDIVDIKHHSGIQRIIIQMVIPIIRQIITVADIELQPHLILQNLCDGVCTDVRFHVVPRTLFKGGHFTYRQQVSGLSTVICIIEAHTKTQAFTLFRDENLESKSQSVFNHICLTGAKTRSHVSGFKGIGVIHFYPERAIYNGYIVAGEIVVKIKNMLCFPSANITIIEIRDHLRALAKRDISSSAYFGSPNGYRTYSRGVR